MSEALYDEVDGENNKGLTFQSIIEKVMSEFPYATIDEDMDGQVIIYTNFYMRKENENN